jgi:ATP-dependent Clp protease ATP-binding subunit ClpA
MYLFLMFEQRFAERGREVLKLALTEASRFNHDHIDPAHLLVGLLREERGAAVRALAASGVTLEAVRERMGAILGHGEEDTGGKPLTLRSKKVLDLALGAAHRLGDERVDTEHLLLALASESEGAAAEVLADLGVTKRELRAEVVSLIGVRDRTGIVPEGLGEEDSTGTLWVPGNDELDLDRPVPAP